MAAYAASSVPQRAGAGQLTGSRNLAESGGDSASVLLPSLVAGRERETRDAKQQWTLRSQPQIKFSPLLTAEGFG